jgi:hypothetical protein
MHYDWAETFYTMFYILDGWNGTSDNNKAKTSGPRLAGAPRGRHTGACA